MFTFRIQKKMLKDDIASIEMDTHVSSDLHAHPPRIHLNDKNLKSNKIISQGYNVHFVFFT